MSDTNHKNCGFAEQTVSYLYDETDARGKAAFESHLENCAQCADEIAGFGLTRSSILEWRNKEFYALGTPQIEIPITRKNHSSYPPATLTEKQSWIGELRKIFAVSPIWATAASLALVVVFAGLFLFVRNFSNNNQTAKNAVKDSPSANISPKNEKTQEIAVENLPENTNRKFTETPAKFINPNGKDSPAKNFESVKTIRTGKIPNNARVETAKVEIVGQRKSNSGYVRKIDHSNTVAKAETFVKKRRIPKLSNIEEDEDETLLLADLLDEVGSK